MTNDVRPDYIRRVALGFRASKMLMSAVELGVFTEIARQPADLATLSQRLGLHRRSAHDFLDALVSHGLLERREGIYQNTVETDLYLDRAKPTYLGGLLDMASKRLYPAWDGLTEAVKTGRPDSRIVTSGSTFEPMYADPDRLRTFLSAMSASSAAAVTAISELFPWQDYRSFVDVGTAQGMVPVTLAGAHAHLTGIGFDLPVVGPLFEEFVAAKGVSDRVKFQSGNFFDDPLPKADVLIMGHILHDWDLKQKRLLLDKAYDALAKGGALIVYETLIDDERQESASGLLMSLTMLLVTTGGFDFTGAECQAWMVDAGFAQTRVQALDGPYSMVVGIK